MSTTQGRLSDGVANAWLATLWRGDAFTAMPTTTHWGLSTTLPGNDGSNITEPTDPSYALIAVTRDHTTFAAPSGRSIATAVDIAFPSSSPGGSGYGLIGWVPVWDTATRTTYLGYWVITGGAVNNVAGDAPTFPAGALTWVDSGT